MAGTGKQPHRSADVNHRSRIPSRLTDLSQDTFEGISIRPEMSQTLSPALANFQAKMSKESLKEPLHD